MPAQLRGSLRGLVGRVDENSPQSHHGEFTRSMTSSVSAVSTRSDVTLVHEDDTETVIDEWERQRGLSVAESIDISGQRSRQGTPTGDDREENRVEGENGEDGGQGKESGDKDVKKDENHSMNGSEDGWIEDKKDAVERGEEREEGEDNGVGTRNMSVAFRHELLNTVHLKIDSRIGLEIARLSDSKYDIVQLIGRCLPHIVPNVILAKREVSNNN